MASIGSSTIESLAGQRPDALNHRVGPHPGCPFQWLLGQTTEEDASQGAPFSAWCTHLQSGTPARGPLSVPDRWNNREGPQARGPSRCLNGRSYVERRAKEAFWSPATRSWKKASVRALTPAMEEYVSLHTSRRQGPRKPSSCTTFTLNPRWGRAATGEKRSCVYEHRVASVVSDSTRPCRLWPVSVSLQTVSLQTVSLSEGTLQARMLERIGQYWLPYLSRALYSLLP